MRCFWVSVSLERIGDSREIANLETIPDVTDMIEYNISCLNKSSLKDHFFQLSKSDPLFGFPCDATSVVGCVIDTPSSTANMQESLNNPLYLRLLLASHLLHHPSIEHKSTVQSSLFLVRA